MTPLRQHRHDRIIHHGQTKESIAVDTALAPFDKAAREMDRKWGIDRLPGLVPPEMAAMYGRTLGSLNAAIDAEDVERVVDRVAACIRGMVVMDAAAVAAGHTPPDPQVVEVDFANQHFGIMLDGAVWERAQAQHPGLRLYTLEEIATIIDRTEMIAPMAAAKDAWPGAIVMDLRVPKRGKIEDSEISF